MNTNNHIAKTVAFLGTFLLMTFGHATGISGVVNSYFKVTSVDLSANTITVDGEPDLGWGDRVLVIQMQGATAVDAEGSDFGKIATYGCAGHFEFLTVCSAEGSGITFLNTIGKAYDLSGAVQLVTVPVYESAEVVGSLTALPWDGEKGGVVAVEVINRLTLHHNITVDGMGFRGGQPSSIATVCGVTGYGYPYGATLGAEKGEGIALAALALRNGKGAFSNGAGGGNGLCGGGGGGANAGIGGYGANGYHVPGCSGSQTAGIGGRAVAYHTNPDLAILGGGGGGGHDRNGFATAGGNGGGLIFIRANEIVSNGYAVSANGDDALTSTGLYQASGAGGGGAGGSIFLDIATYMDSLAVNVKGGIGGSVSDPASSHGTGGGGSGGVIHFSQTTLSPMLNCNVMAGMAGTIAHGVNPLNGSTVGANNGTTGLVLLNSGIYESASFAGKCVLPEVMGTLKATLSNGVSELSWDLLSEVGEGDFRILRSEDGVTFEEIGVVKAGAAASYHYSDASLSSGIRTFYRVQLLKDDGTAYTSNIVEVLPENSTSGTRAYPNPVPQGRPFTVAFSELSDETVLTLHSFAGKEVYKTVIDTGLNQVVVQTDNLESGVYLLSVSNGTKKEAHKIVITR